MGRWSWSGRCGCHGFMKVGCYCWKLRVVVCDFCGGLVRVVSPGEDGGW